MRYKAIIFDLDGVICHTDRYHYLAWKGLADKLGVYFDEEINNRLRGVSRMDSLEIILERYHGEELSQTNKEELADEKNEIYKQLLNRMTSDDLSPVVKNTLDMLREKGMKLAIGSSSKNARLILNQIGLLNYFDVISDGTNITYSKPNPEVFIKAAYELDISPSECLVVEDAVTGVEAAKAGGMDCAAIGNAVTSQSADYKLIDFSELLNVASLDNRNMATR